MFIIKVDIKEGKALIIGSYNNTFKMGVIITLRTILRYA
jgi:hypothetical protein